MKHFDRVETVDRTGESVDLAVAYTSDGRLDANLRQTHGMTDADMLRIQSEWCTRPPFVQGLLESAEYEARMRFPAHEPANDGTDIVVQTAPDRYLPRLNC
ncbi:hypothetical protein GCM10019059_36450 [Camelimonas fluminis]|nr:hypothetical protein GCM10019059_36450 [Camelimonas fluminis]